MPQRRPRALVYGDVNLNIIDGSAIWLLAVAETFAKAGCEVTVPLKASVDTARLVDTLDGLDGVRVRRTIEEGLAPRGVTELNPSQASAVLRRQDEQEPFDLVVVRGLALVDRLVEDGSFDGRLWTYLTDVPQHVPLLTEETVDKVDRIARASRVMLCQTEELRCFLEAALPSAAGKCWLLPPSVPAPEFTLPKRAPLAGRTIKLVYSGKFAPMWRTSEMTRLPGALRRRGLPAELHAVGDKVHKVREDPGWTQRMQLALSETPGVIWHGGSSRQAALQLAAGCDFGVSWRDPALDASLELSTKLLEYGAVGLPVLLNRTPMHEALLGADYPLFVGDEREVVDAVATAVADPAVHDLAVARCQAAAAAYSQQNAVDLVRGHLDRAFPTSTALAGRSRRLRVGVAGHDLKFFTRLLEHLQALPQLDVRVDQWTGMREHDQEHSNALVEWADVLVVEWCGPAAVWFSKRKRKGQRLIVRLHRFELEAGWPAQLDIDAVDQVVCVSPYYARRTRELTGWPAHKVVVVPNWVDVVQFDRPKLPGAEHHLGFIGMAPMRKRTDLALDMLRELRRDDPRYRLFVKTKMPWDYWWIWSREHERTHTAEVLRRVQTDPLLRGGVVFDSFGPDVAAWLRRLGFVLSTSDDESFHLSPAEGMASGAVPVVRNWPGADEIYDPRWVHGSVAEMAEAVGSVVSTGRWESERRYAQQRVAQAFPLEAVCDMFVRLLVEDLPSDERPLMPAATADPVPPASGQLLDA